MLGAIEDTRNAVGVRLYGGHILIATGEVNMVNCHIWDALILLQLTDAIAIGGDLLVRLCVCIMDASGCRHRSKSVRSRPHHTHRTRWHR